MAYDLAPFDLSWAEVDPRLHPFDGRSAPAVVAALGPAREMPVRPPGSAVDQAVTDWSHSEARAWTEAMTRALVERFGRWVLGWRWAHDEGEIGGGPVGSWCCSADSITSPGETLARVATALCEWRAWLEDLAERFEWYRLDSVPVEDRQRVWEGAVVHLVTHVVDRTGAGDAWYGHCAQVLTWYLERWGVAAATAHALVDEAIGGRFGSWIGPESEVVDEVAQRLAVSLAQVNGG